MLCKEAAGGSIASRPFYAGKLLKDIVVRRMEEKHG